MKGVKISNGAHLNSDLYRDDAVTDFWGYVSRGAQGGDSLDPERCVFSIYRITPDDEVDSADGSHLRVEAGRDFTGIYWNNMGTWSKFIVTLQQASYLQSVSQVVLISGLVATLF